MRENRQQPSCGRISANFHVILTTDSSPAWLKLIMQMTSHNNYFFTAVFFSQHRSWIARVNRVDECLRKTLCLFEWLKSLQIKIIPKLLSPVFAHCFREARVATHHLTGYLWTLRATSRWCEIRITRRCALLDHVQHNIRHRLKRNLCEISCLRNVNHFYSRVIYYHLVWCPSLHLRNFPPNDVRYCILSNHSHCSVSPIASLSLFRCYLLHLWAMISLFTNSLRQRWVWWVRWV